MRRLSVITRLNFNDATVRLVAHEEASRRIGITIAGSGRWPIECPSSYTSDSKLIQNSVFLSEPRVKSTFWILQIM